MNPLTFLVCGPTCCGKGAWINDRSTTAVISVSSIVKQLTGETKRSVLSQTNGMHQLISRGILIKWQNLATAGHKEIYIDGIRQPEILNQIVSTIGILYTRLVYIDPGKQQRQEWFQQRCVDRPDDDLDFAATELSDVALGISKIREIAQFWGQIVDPR